MPIFQARRLEDLVEAAKRRHNIMASSKRFSMAPDEFIACYIKPQHIESLSQVQELVGSIGTSYLYTHETVDGVEAKLSCSFTNKPPIIIPSYCGVTHSEYAPPPIVENLHEWIRERMKLSALFGDAVDGIRWLNEHAGDARAFRATFPALTVLLKDIANGDDKSAPAKQAAKLQMNQSVTNLPKLPREVKLRLIEASNLIIATTLMRADDQRLPDMWTEFAVGFRNWGRDHAFYPTMTATNC